MRRSRGKRSEWVMLSAVFFFWFSVYTYPSFLSAYVTDKLHASEFMTGLIIGSYGFTQMILRIPLGIFSDMLKKRKLFVLVGFAASMLASALLTLVDRCVPGAGTSQWVQALALAARGLSGVAVSTWVTFSVLYSASYESDELTSAVSRLMVPQYGSQILAMLLGAQMADRFGEGAAFVLALAAGAIGLALAATIREHKPTGDPMRLRDLFTVLRDRSLVAGTTLATLMRVVCWCTVLGFLPNWAKDVAGLRTGELGYLSVMYLLPNTIVARLSGSVLLRRFKMRDILSLGFLLMAAACVLYPHARSIWPLMGAQVLFGTGMGLIVPLTLSSAIQNIPDAKRGAAMGVYQAIYGVGMFVGPVIAGWILSRSATETAGYIANFYSNAAVALLGAALARRLFSRRNFDKK